MQHNSVYGSWFFHVVMCCRLDEHTGELTMLAGAGKGDHVLRVNVEDKHWKKTVTSTVTAAVAYLNDTVVSSSTSLRLEGEFLLCCAHRFISRFWYVSSTCGGSANCIATSIMRQCKKGKEEYLYSAFYILCISQSAQAWITQFYLQIHHACLSLVCVHQMAPPLTEVRAIQLQLTTHLSTPKGWKAELAWLVDL